MKTKNQKFREICKATDAGLVSTVIELCEAYIKDFPKSKPVAVWNFYADALADSSNYKEAHYWYSKTVKELEKQNSKLLDYPYAKLGKLFQRKGDFKNAIIWYEKASEVSPSEATYLIYLGTAHYRLGNIKVAEGIIIQATNCKEGCIDEAFYNLGVILGSQKRYREALVCFEQALEIDSKYTLAKLGIKDMKQVLAVLENK